VYPPVGTQNSKPKTQNKKKSYYLAGGRLARAKRVDLAVEACTKLNIPLKVFGKGFAGYGEELKEMAGSNIEFLGEVTEEKKLELMAHAKAYIFPSDTEDFGITPVEAMTMGTPVIAHKSGGVLETIKEGESGMFFADLSVDALIESIKASQKIKWNRQVIIESVERFSKERFVENFQKCIKSK
jgi:glycosyltransferase involved in cell wall biosynthesis